MSGGGGYGPLSTVAIFKILNLDLTTKNAGIRGKLIKNSRF